VHQPGVGHLRAVQFEVPHPLAVLVRLVLFHC
jgi:hypothetical protein